MDFDLTLSQIHPNGASLDYGLLTGNETVAFIKSGRGGTHRGQDDKYLQMASRIHKHRGYTVICAPNPIDYDTYDTDKLVLDRYATERGLSEPDVCLIGSSNGAYQNLLLAGQIKPPRRIICINMPLMLNFHRSTAILQSMTETEKIMVYGDKDPSARYLPFLEVKSIHNLRVIRMDGADHSFSGMTADFVALADLL